MPLNLRACCRHCKNSTLVYDDFDIEKRFCTIKNKKRSIFAFACDNFEGNQNVHKVWKNENNQIMIKWFMG